MVMILLILFSGQVDDRFNVIEQQLSLLRWVDKNCGFWGGSLSWAMMGRLLGLLYQKEVRRLINNSPRTELPDRDFGLWCVWWWMSWPSEVTKKFRRAEPKTLEKIYTKHKSFTIINNFRRADQRAGCPCQRASKVNSYFRFWRTPFIQKYILSFYTDSFSTSRWDWYFQATNTSKILSTEFK